ncbi:LysR family transcriptional regulator [Pandoraea sputorum]|uniref:LysR family transcriptional regulator n=1 Tax=Pandoraea sputorum TaxID=93222 RepID=UPI001E5400EF|nr:LysR family transcriptional regulator [Pandoraea sputorum]MCE4060356.1 LysR family transcriptional regulator [Pandoraea sputorum]
MDIIANMRAFVCVAEEGSFTLAAKRLSTPRGGVSRAVSTLEEHLQARLLNRNTRHVALTEAGARYLEKCREVLEALEEAEAVVAHTQASPSGQLRVHASSGIGLRYLVPAIVEYRQRYSGVSVDLTLAQRTPDIIDEGYDVAVIASLGELPDSNLVAKSLGSVHSVLCAAPSYLASNGAPKQLSDLASHPCLRPVSMVTPRDRWRLDGPNGTETLVIEDPGFAVNSADALGIALRAGIGIGALPVPAAAPALSDGSLVRVLPEYRLQSLPLYAVYPSRHYLSTKTRAFVDLICDLLPVALAADAHGVE